MRDVCDKCGEDIIHPIWDYFTDDGKNRYCKECYQRALEEHLQEKKVLQGIKKLPVPDRLRKIGCDGVAGIQIINTTEEGHFTLAPMVPVIEEGEEE